MWCDWVLGLGFQKAEIKILAGLHSLWSLRRRICCRLILVPGWMRFLVVVGLRCLFLCYLSAWGLSQQLQAIYIPWDLALLFSKPGMACWILLMFWNSLTTLLTSRPRLTGLLWLSHSHPDNLPIFFLFLIFIYLAVLGLSYSTWDLVPWPGIEPGLSALGAWSLNHWTPREVPPYLKVNWFVTLKTFAAIPRLVFGRRFVSGQGSLGIILENFQQYSFQF